MARRPLTLLAPVLALGLLLAACGSDDGGDGVSATTTTGVPDAFSDAEVTAAAMAYGEAVLDEDVDAVHEMLSERCRAKVTTTQLETVLRVILVAMEQAQGAEASDVRINGALVSDIDAAAGTAQAALVLDQAAFDDPNFAFLQAQQYVYEDGAWRNDACDFESIREAGRDLAG